MRPAFLNVSLEPLTVAVEAAEVVAITAKGEEEAPVSCAASAPTRSSATGRGRDISKAIRSLLRGRDSQHRNDIVIRGGAPNENRFYIDGIEIRTSTTSRPKGRAGRWG